MAKSVSLSVGRGEKLSASRGAGLTKKGRDKYNRATGSNLKAPVTEKNPKRQTGETKKKVVLCANEGSAWPYEQEWQANEERRCVKTLAM